MKLFNCILATLIIIGVGVLSFYTSWLVSVFSLPAFLIEFYFLRRFFLTQNTNVLIVHDPDTPTIVDVRMIGRKKWSALKVGTDSDLRPFVTSTGSECMFATAYDGVNIKASWIHEIDRTQFLLKSEIHTTAITFAESLYKEFTKIRDIPRLLSIRIAGQAITVYEDDKLRDITTLDPAFNAEDIMTMLKGIKDPMDDLRTKEGMTDATQQ